MPETQQPATQTLGFGQSQDFSVPIDISAPQPLKYHFIENRELEAMVKIYSPISLSIGTGLIGFSVTQIKIVLDFCNAWYGHFYICPNSPMDTVCKNANSFIATMQATDPLLGLLGVVALIAGGFLTFYAILNKSELSKIIQEIKTRPSYYPASPEAATAPIASAKDSLRKKPTKENKPAS